MQEGWLCKKGACGMDGEKKNTGENSPLFTTFGDDYRYSAENYESKP